jgi:hypothetical protein
MVMNPIAKDRIRNQRFENHSFSKAAQVVAWFGAIQGQEYAQTKWGIGLRAPALSDADVEKELQDGQILRTHLLRPTWHFVAAKDIRWMLKLTAPTVHQASAYMYRQLEMSKQLFSKCNRIIERLLTGGRCLTRDQINQELLHQGVVASGPRLSYIMMNAELEALICSGPRTGKRFTYALLDERVAPVKPLTREEALAELTARYFTSRGPATIHDFATWSGLKVADCKTGISSISQELAEERIDNTLYYRSRRQPKLTITPRMLLLPIYDELIMGYKDRRALAEYKDRLKPSPKLRFPATILWDGQIIGTWRRVVSNKRLKTEFDLFKAPTSIQKKELNVARLRLEIFSDMELIDL